MVANNQSMPKRLNSCSIEGGTIEDGTILANLGNSFFQEFAQAVLNDNPKTAVEFANEIFDDDSGKILKYRQLLTHPKHREVWMHSSVNEFGRLAQGVGGRIQGTDTIFFIHKSQVPVDR